MDPFLLRVLLSFVLGGLAVALFTAAAERLGSRVGGLLLSFPVKVTIALVLIGVSEGTLLASEAARAVPAGLGANVVFLGAAGVLVHRLPPRAALAGALVAWAAAAGLVLWWEPTRWPWSLLAWLAPAVLALALVPRETQPARARASGGRFGARGLLLRALGAGVIVALALVLARVGGPVLGGLASVFPSGWITSVAILAQNHGAAFTSATVRVMLFASASPVAFGYAVWWAYPLLGVALGTLVAMGTALAVSLAVAALLRTFDVTAPRPRPSRGAP